MVTKVQKLEEKNTKLLNFGFASQEKRVRGLMVAEVGCGFRDRGSDHINALLRIIIIIIIIIIDLFIVGTAKVTICTYKNQHYVICKKSLQILHLQKFEIFLILK